MSYCIMRIEKIKTFGHMNGCYQHNYRIRETSNAIPELKDLNEELVKDFKTKTYEEAFTEHTSASGYGIEKRIRSNAVLALEVFTSFSREERDNIDLEEWKKDNLKWLRENFNANPEKYGDNVLSVMYHADEVGNVHCHAFVVPLNDKGELSANYYIGKRENYINLQNSYAQAMQKHGLERGIEGSIADHREIKKFYAELQNAMNIPIPEYTKEDTLETYREKIEDFIKTLQAAHLKEINNKKREIIEAASLPHRDYKIMERQYNEEHHKRVKLEKEKNELIQEFGPLNVIKPKLRTMDLINEGLQNHPDIEKSNQITADLNQLVQWSKERRKKEKKRTKVTYNK